MYISCMSCVDVSLSCNCMQIILCHCCCQRKIVSWSHCPESRKAPWPRLLLVSFSVSAVCACAFIRPQNLQRPRKQQLLNGIKGGTDHSLLGFLRSRTRTWSGQYFFNFFHSEGAHRCTMAKVRLFPFWGDFFVSHAFVKWPSICQLVLSCW